MVVGGDWVDRRYKKMESELEIYQVQTEELKRAIEQVHTQMMDLKEQYFRNMRAEERRLRQEEALD